MKAVNDSAQAPTSLKEQAIDVCVLGNGPVALAAVMRAKQLGLSVVQLACAPVLKANHSEKTAVSRTYAISPNVQKSLTDLGVWGLLAVNAVQRCEAMHIAWELDVKPAKWTTLSAAEANVNQLCCFVAEADLHAALSTAASVVGASKACVFYPEDVPPVIKQCSPIALIHTNSTQYSAKLCLIAEGASSASAASIGLAPTVYDYQHSAVVAVVGCDQVKSSAGHAWQWLGGASAGNDVLALLPMPELDGQARFGLVWSQPSETAAQFVADHNRLIAALNARCGATVGILSLLSDVQQFPLTQSKVNDLTLGQVVIVGDTAHKIHPLAGQGLNLGFEDVFALFKVLEQREPWRSVDDPRILARYARRRAGHIGLVQTLVHALALRGKWPQPLQIAANWAISAQENLPSLAKLVRTTVVRRATGV